MKITFDPNGDNYIEIIPSQGDKVHIIISARDGNNTKKTIVNSAEITRDELNDMIKELDSSSLPNKTNI
ncbi:MAG TPA: hypothetical protein VM577_04385 [Anaerovoracaceae bacterium]|nr:hypothetical protein [Anaerovoracaceae bacterium]